MVLARVHGCELPPPNPMRMALCTALIECVIKFCFDGFGETRHNKTADYFQFCWGVVSVAGVQHPKVNSRKNMHPIVTVEGKESTAIPLALAAFNTHMCAYTGLDFRNVLLKPDGTMRIKLRKPFKAVGSDGIERLVEWMRPVVSADVKAVLIALGRMGASANYYCFFNLDKCIREANESCLHALDGVSTMGSLRRALAEVEEIGEYNGAGGWKERMEAACRRGEFVSAHSLKENRLTDARWTAFVELGQLFQADPAWFPAFQQRNAFRVKGDVELHVFVVSSTPVCLTSLPTHRALGSTTCMLGPRLRQQSRLM